MHGGGGSRGGGGFGGGGFGGGGFRGGPRPGPGGPHMHMHFFGPGWGWGRRYYGPGGCISGLITSVVLILVVVVFFFVSLFQSPNITKSTVERDKLGAGETTLYEKWYSDEDHIVIKEAYLENKLLTQMRYFYDKTGVQPYLYVTNEIHGNKQPMTEDFKNFEKELYAELFGNDGGHMILLYFESSITGKYTSDIYAGDTASAVIDAEGIEIVLDYVDYYYEQDSLSYEEVFASSFHDSADRLMGGKTKFYEDWSVGVWISVVLGVVLVVVILISAFGKSRKQDGKDDSTYTRNNSGSSDDFGGYDGNNYSKF